MIRVTFLFRRYSVHGTAPSLPRHRSSSGPGPTTHIGKFVGNLMISRTSSFAGISTARVQTLTQTNGHFFHLGPSAARSCCRFGLLRGQPPRVYWIDSILFGAFSGKRSSFLTSTSPP